MRTRLFLLSVLLLTACDPAKIGQETQEAVNNLSNEAMEIHNDVKNTVDQFNQTVDSVSQATEDIKNLTQPKASAED